MLMTCYSCGLQKQLIRKNKLNPWRCRKCYMKFIANPKIDKQKNAIRSKKYYLKYPEKMKLRNGRVMLFKDKRIHLKDNPRKGKCTICGLKVGDKYINNDGKEITIKQTQIHHFVYHYDDPLKDAIEVCVKCHKEKHLKKDIIP